ncbi:MAG TPA: cobaltochelatase subunit CobN, partial [Dehalococcoidia bacterium]|nr:cobaltochelatase subunit CobN [Dehalococcoidia bacterium]
MFVFLSMADTEILTLSHARATLPAGFGAVRAANPNQIVDLETFLADVAGSARVVVARLLGGRRAWDPGFDRLAALCRERGIVLLAFPGDQQPDPELAAACTVEPTVAGHVFEYLLQGGVQNFRNCLLYLSDALLETRYGAAPPRELPWEGIYHPDFPDGVDQATYRAAKCPPNRPTVGLLFYRAHWMSGNTTFLDALIRRLEDRGCNVLPVFCFSLKDDRVGPSGAPRAFADFFEDGAGGATVDAIVSTLSFSMGQVVVQGAALATGWSVEYLERLDVPILQAVVATSSHDRWAASPNGLSPLDTAMNVAMPEFDGRIITVPFCFKEEAEHDPELGVRLQRYVPVSDRVDHLAGLAANWARLRRKPNAEKRIAFILSNYPTKNARIGNAVGLDTPASLVRLLRALADQGYRVGPIPEDGDALIHALIAAGSHDREYLTADQIAAAAGKVPAKQYAAWQSAYPAQVQTELRDAWGDPPGEVLVYDDQILVGGMQLENVFVGIQPPRGFGENPVAIYHNPDLPPTYHYLAYYQWLRDVFRADAVVHLGKHGTLEWLPGKSVGLSAECYPEVALGDLPNIYPFIINNPGEGAQAKRRSHATIVDHLVPVMTRAETYDELTRLEQLLDEYYQVQTLDPKKLPLIREQIWDLVTASRLDRDLGTAERPGEADFDSFLLHIDGYLCELKDSQIRDGLHILGQVPAGEAQTDLLLALTRLDNLEVPSLRTAIGRSRGIDYPSLLADRGQTYAARNGGCGHDPAACALCAGGPALCRSDRPDHISNGDVVERIEAVARRLLTALGDRGFDPAAVRDVINEAGLAASPGALRVGPATDSAPSSWNAGVPPALGWSGDGDAGGEVPATDASPVELVNSPGKVSAADQRRLRGAGETPALQAGEAGDVHSVLRLVTDEIVPHLARTTDEIAHVIRGLDGRYVPAGPSGAPTRGMANVLPTGRNFYSVDPKTLPSPAAWEVGRQLGDALLAKYLAEAGEYPQSVGLVVWGTSAMRTHGDDIAEILYLLGVRPVWQRENRRVTGVEVIPLEELGRSRIDVTVRISGFFRDAFPNLVHLLDQAFDLVARLDEPDDQNYVAAH